MKWKKEHNLKKLTGPNGDLNKSHDESASDEATSPKADTNAAAAAFTSQLSGHMMGVMKVEGQG